MNKNSKKKKMAESLLFLKNVINYVSNRVEAKNRFILLCLFFNIHPSNRFLLLSRIVGDWGQ